MNDSKNHFIHSAMMHGLFLGLALVLFNVVLYLTGNYASQVLGLFVYVILIGGLLWAQYDFRKDQPGGYCTYSKALGYGTVVVLFSSFFTALYTLILLAYIDKGLIDQIKMMQEEALLSKGYSADMVEQQMNMASPYMTPGFISVTSIIISTFIGFVLSLITSIFTHKSNPDPFIQAMSEIEKEEQPSSPNIEEPKSVEETSVEEPSKDKKEE